MSRKSRRQKLSAGEWDTVSRYARSVLCYLQRAGKKAWYKTQMNRRWRRNEKKEMKARDPMGEYREHEAWEGYERYEQDE